MPELSAATVPEIIEELTSRDATEFNGAVVSYSSFDETKRWNPIAIASGSLAGRHLTEILARAKDQSERP